MVSLLCNPLATAAQLADRPSRADGIPADLETTLIWAGCTLIQSAGILLHLPQKTIATASILLQRFYLLASLRAHPLRPTVHAALYLSSKLTEHPVKPRDIINATTYLLRVPSPSPISPARESSTPTPDGPEVYYVPESVYHASRTALLTAETHLLSTLGFQTTTSLPYALALNYLQSLSALDAAVARRAFAYLNDALLSPCLLYLTHQPNALAVAAVYLAAREAAVKLPAGWWEVFDVEREELGFLVVGMRGVGEFAEGCRRAWRGEGGGGRGLWGAEELEGALERRRVLEEAVEEAMVE